jgi:hypothetical protein
MSRDKATCMHCTHPLCARVIRPCLYPEPFEPASLAVVANAVREAALDVAVSLARAADTCVTAPESASPSIAASLLPCICDPPAPQPHPRLHVLVISGQGHEVLYLNAAAGLGGE